MEEGLINHLERVCFLGLLFEALVVVALIVVVAVLVRHVHGCFNHVLVSLEHIESILSHLSIWLPMRLRGGSSTTRRETANKRSSRLAGVRPCPPGGERKVEGPVVGDRSPKRPRRPRRGRRSRQGPGRQIVRSSDIESPKVPPKQGKRDG